MIEVKLTLWNPWEMAVVNEAMAIIHKARFTPQTGLEDTEPPPPPAAAPEVTTVTPEVTPAPVVAHIAPETGEWLTLDDVDEAMKALYQAKGLKAALDVLAAFDAKRTNEVPAERWGELLEKIKEASA